MKRLATFLFLTVVVSSLVCAQEYTEISSRLPLNVYNVARPDFGDYVRTGGRSTDLGLANFLPVGLERDPDSYGDKMKIFIFRNPRPILMKKNQTIKFRIRIDHADVIFVWPESEPGPGRFYFSIKEILPDGERKTRYGGVIYEGIGQHFYLQVVRHDQTYNPVANDFNYLHQPFEMEFSITLQGYKPEFKRMLWLTVSPSKILEERYIHSVPLRVWDWP